MSHAPFVHLRVHTAYSLAKGAIPVKQLIKDTAKLKMPAVAVTDLGNMFGAMEFSFSAPGAGVQPIIGTNLFIKNEDNFSSGRNSSEAKPYQIILLVQSPEGYANIMKLVSKSFMESDGEPQLALSDLEGFTEGLLCLTGGVTGPIGGVLVHGKMDAASKRLDYLSTLFPNRLYIELMRHGAEHEAIVEKGLLELSETHNLPIVATNECYFPTEEFYEAHDALLCISGGRYVDEADRPRLNPTYHFRSAEEMVELFSDLPEAIENTLKIAQRCAHFLEFVNPILPPFPTEGGRSEAEELRAQSIDGLKGRLDVHVFTEDMSEAEREETAKPYWDRLDFELSIIEQMGFPGYFLIVSDFIKWAKDHDIPVGPGRGSGAGSVVAWALTITDLDPLRFGLLFERFLNPERVSMPDFDVDFCQDRREEVIEYVQDYYGHDRVAQIITFGKLQAKAVVRDVGRVLQMPYGQVDRLSKLIPNNPANPVSLSEALEQEADLRAARDSDEQVARLIGIALQLEGLYRNASTHAAGVVIGDRPLEQLVPLYRDPRSDMPVTQYNMKFVESTGLIKFDFLGLKTLTVIKKAVDFLKERHIDPKIDEVPLDDKRTYELLSRAETVGVFQLESSGMRNVLKDLEPTRFEDIIAILSLYRPGPMDNIPTYVACKRGEQEPDYMHPLLQPILEETFGIMIYQEQVMQAAQIMAGYTLGGADMLRRAMGKKIKEEMDRQRQIFIEGAKEKDVPEAQSNHIFDQINKFAGYGFNKSHAAAYALVSYHTAYLKANYPVEFMAAIMTLDMGNTDKLRLFKDELRRMGVELRTPDVNISRHEFRVEEIANEDRQGGAIRYALAAIKGVGEEAMKAIVKERDEHGPYQDVFDFAKRHNNLVINKRQLENLTCAGAFDSLMPDRAQMFAAIETIIRYAQSLAQEKASGQNSLFGGDLDVDLAKPKLPMAEEWDELTRLNKEAKAIGFCLSAHPLDQYMPLVGKVGLKLFTDIEDAVAANGAVKMKLAGTISFVQERISKKGNKFAFIGVSDPTGDYEMMMFADTLAVSRDMLQVNMPVILHADIRMGDDGIRMLCHQVEYLEELARREADGIVVNLTDRLAVPELAKIVADLGHGSSRVRVDVAVSDRKIAEILLSGSYKLSVENLQALRSLNGVRSVRDL